jgi:hypothetical protein
MWRRLGQRGLYIEQVGSGAPSRPNHTLCELLPPLFVGSSGAAGSPRRWRSSDAAWCAPASLPYPSPRLHLH